MVVVVIWYNPKKDIYYHKVNQGTYRKYKIGDSNSYGHQVFYVVDDIHYNFSKGFSRLRRSLKRFVRFLDNKL